MSVKAIFIGFGARGQIYADFALSRPSELEIAAVAEPQEHLRALAVEKYACPENRCYGDWESLFADRIPGDAVFISTQDNGHVAPALAAIKSGYLKIMLEKPIDRDIDKCVHLMQTAKKYGAEVQVCHTLRYMPLYRRLKQELDSGAVGNIVHLSLLEGYGFFPFAHSYVRGDWAVSEESSPLLLAKCCHDTDMIFFLTGRHWSQVSSFGELSHFNISNAPGDSAHRCIDCSRAKDCIFSALHYGKEYKNTPLYRNAVEKEGFKNLDEALKFGRYGKCVYRCANTAPDHQTVNILLEGGITANLTVSGFSDAGRKMHIMGTEGEIFCDVLKGILSLRRFGENNNIVINIPKSQEHHGGADRILVEDFIASVRGGKPVTDISGAIESHEICDAAERSRLENKIIFSSAHTAAVSLNECKEPA